MTKLQRYDMEAISHTAAWVEDKPCSDGDWVKSEDAEAVEKENEDLKRENAALKATIEKMKRCVNCNNYLKTCHAPLWNYCVNYNKWEMKQ